MIRFIRAAVVALALAIVLSSPTEAQMADKKFKSRDLIGVWDYVAAFQRFPDGRIVHQFGDPPAGRFIITRGGLYLHWVQRPDLPQIASGRITQLTDAEAHAVAEGILGHFGTWEADEIAGTFTVQIDKASFANFDGISQVRVVTELTREKLMYENQTSVGGAGVVVVAELRRVE